MKRLYLNLVIVVAALIGLYDQLMPQRWYNLTFYTVLSNILILGIFSYMVIQQANQKTMVLSSRWFIRLKGGATMAIMLTFLVYIVLLMPRTTLAGFMTWGNWMCHLVVPLLTLWDWWRYDNAGQYHVLDPLWWTVTPLLYAIYALIRGTLDKTPLTPRFHSSYPYFFMEIDKIGWQGFSIYFVALLVVYVGLGYGLYMAKRANDNTDTNEK